MAIFFHIDHSKERLRFSATVRFTFSEFSSAWDPFRQKNPFNDCSSLLWDLSAMDASSVMESDLQKVVEYLLSSNGIGRQPVDVALVVPTRATSGLARTYLGILMEDQEHFEVFRSVQAGVDWLDERARGKTVEAKS